MRYPRRHSTRLLASLLVGLFVLPAVAQGQALENQNTRIQELLERDRTLGFTPRTAALAASSLLDPDVLGDRRQAALFALGAIGSVAHRDELEQWAEQGRAEDRCAALLALGEFGQQVAGADLTLIRLLGNSDRNIAGCALASLIRARPDVGRARAQALADENHPVLGKIARAMIRWEDGSPNADASPYLRRLFLRWSAARDFGTVEGRSWEMVQVDRLAENSDFLDELVLMSVSRSPRAGVHDHVLSMLLEGRGMPSSLRCAVRVMPDELDLLIASKRWVPRDNSEWLVLIHEAIDAGVEKRLFRSFEIAAVREELLPRVAPHLSARDERFDGLTLRAMRDLDIVRRAEAAGAVGEAALTRLLPELVDLSGDRAFEVRAAAWVARVRLGDLGDTERSAAQVLRDLFVDAREEGGRPNRERRAFLDAIHNARRSALVLDMSEALLSSMAPLDTPGADAERVSLLATLRTSGRRIEQGPLQDALDGRFLSLERTISVVEALGTQPRLEDVEMLERTFPTDGQWRLNLALAQALLAEGSEEVLPVLEQAVWNGPIDRSVLAALVVAENYGMARLLHWVTKPPAEATSEDVRRLGFAIGAWGLKEGVDDLRARLGTVNGADRPALQGALLGLLTARTR